MMVPAPLVQVCSHRANASELPEVAALGPHASLVQRMHALEEQAGIVCFDLDLSVTKKGRLVVGHPNDIKVRGERGEAGRESAPGSSVAGRLGAP